jgi:transposase
MSGTGGEAVLFEADEAAEPPRRKVPAGSAKTFRHYDQAQSFLLPPSLDDWLAEAHEARFISEVVDELLDLSSIYDSYLVTDGAPPYDPKMMLKLLLYGYSTGVTSSREIERRCEVDLAFRWLAANAAPDYRSISRFRRRHLGALDELFVKVLALCFEAGLVKLGRVALDGTKLRASASKHKAMSYDRLGPKIEQLEGEVATILAEAEATDLAEDETFGTDHRGDEVPAELARRETRLEKMRAAKEAIEADARDKAATRAAKRAQREDKGDDEVAEAAARAAEKATPEGRAQRSFTDPAARMMKTNDGFQHAYNAQGVVDEASQVVLGIAVTQQASDVEQLTSMIEVMGTTLEAAGIEASPKVVLADAGYCSEANLEELDELEINALVATGRIRRGERVSPAPRGRMPKDLSRREKMARRLRTKAGRTDYARRKAIVEPAFGQMKVRQHAGQLRLRGLEGAKGEWALHTICHNLRKLAKVANLAPLGVT